MSDLEKPRSHLGEGWGGRFTAVGHLGMWRGLKGSPSWLWWLSHVYVYFSESLKFCGFSLWSFSRDFVVHQSLINEDGLKKFQKKTAQIGEGVSMNSLTLKTLLGGKSHLLLCGKGGIPKASWILAVRPAWGIASWEDEEQNRVESCISIKPNPKFMRLFRQTNSIF